MGKAWMFYAEARRGAVTPWRSSDWRRVGKLGQGSDGPAEYAPGSVESPAIYEVGTDILVNRDRCSNESKACGIDLDIGVFVRGPEDGYRWNSNDHNSCVPL